MRRYCRLLVILSVLMFLFTACGGAGEEIADDFPIDPETISESVDPETQPGPVDPGTASGPVDPETQPGPVDPETQPGPVDPETQPGPVDPETTPGPVDPEEEPEYAELSGEQLPEVNIVGDGIRVDALDAIYLPEQGRYVPFLVLSADYAGNALLLRRDVLPEFRPLNDYSAAYPDSALDRFLNTEYLQRLDLARPFIQPVEITVTDENALGVSGDTVRTVTREIFLLSCAETGFTELYNAGKEGTALSYFDAPEHRIAYRENGPAVSWWLRTPDTYYLSAAYGIGPDGTLGSGNAYNENGVRPAFCVPPDAQAFPTTDIVRGQTLYFLSAVADENL
ncbi:MAG: hypothetical protein IJR54_05495 [Oscillibacter sp.]|nr:hypothetical protein [Oscillibacter sp.]